MRTTSLFAYHTEVKPNLSSKQEKVLEAFHTSTAADMTNAELAQVLKWPINTVTPRTNELVKKGKLRESTRRRCWTTGRTAIAWMLATVLLGINVSSTISDRGDDCHMEGDVNTCLSL